MDLDGPNKLETVPGAKSMEPVEHMTPEEIRKRRKTLSRLMHTGLSDDEIIEAMTAEGYQLDRRSYKKTKDDLFAKWASEDGERAPHLKGAARRRIYRHIQDAALLAQYNAVASLEKTLAAVEGTSLEENKSEPASARQINAVIMILGDMKPEQALELMQAEIERTAGALPSPEGSPLVIDVESK